MPEHSRPSAGVGKGRVEVSEWDEAQERMDADDDEMPGDLLDDDFDGVDELGDLDDSDEAGAALDDMDLDDAVTDDPLTDDGDGLPDEVRAELEALEADEASQRE